MKFTLARPTAPRNPLVAPARFRHAGAHRTGVGAQRQQAQRALMQELGRRLDRHRDPADPHRP